MEANLYVSIEFSQSTNYVMVTDWVVDFMMERSHYNYVNAVDTIIRDDGKRESLKGYKLRFVPVTVNYNGNKGITKEDVLRCLEEDGYVRRAVEMYGSFYTKTSKLEKLLQVNLDKRKELIDKGEFIIVNR